MNLRITAQGVHAHLPILLGCAVHGMTSGLGPLLLEMYASSIAANMCPYRGVDRGILFASRTPISTRRNGNQRSVNNSGRRIKGALATVLKTSCIKMESLTFCRNRAEMNRPNCSGLIGSMGDWAVVYMELRWDSMDCLVGILLFTVISRSLRSGTVEEVHNLEMSSTSTVCLARLLNSILAPRIGRLSEVAAEDINSFSCTTTPIIRVVWAACFSANAIKLCS